MVAQSLSAPKFSRRLLFNVSILFLEFVALFYLVVTISVTENFTRSFDRSLWPLTPAEIGLQYQEVTFPAAEDKLNLRGWYIPATTPSEKLLILLHGNITSRTTWLRILPNLAQQGYNLLLFDFRGCGQSEGDTVSFGYYEQRDVQGAIDYAKELGFKSDKIGLVGQSAGAATGLIIFSRNHEIKAMVSDSSFADLNSELEHALPFYTKEIIQPLFLPGIQLWARLVHGIDTNQVNPEEAVKNLKDQHVLFIHSQIDKIVPLSHFYRLKNAAGSAAESWLVPDAPHIVTTERHPEEYVYHLVKFFDKYL